MNLHEFQAKALLERRGIPIPVGQVAWTPDEAVAIAGELGGADFAVKAQIQAGGRGAAGGVKIAAFRRGGARYHGRDARLAACHRANRREPAAACAASMSSRR